MMCYYERIDDNTLYGLSKELMHNTNNKHSHLFRGIRVLLYLGDALLRSSDAVGRRSKASKALGDLPHVYGDHLLLCPSVLLRDI